MLVAIFVSIIVTNIAIIFGSFLWNQYKHNFLEFQGSHEVLILRRLSLTYDRLVED